MSRTLLVLAASTVLSLALLGLCPAQQAHDPGPVPGMPVAGPPPEGDGLPPTSPEARRVASMQMLLLVVLALAAIFLLLRLISRGRREPLPPSPEQELVDRAQRALEERDRAELGEGQQERSGTTPHHADCASDSDGPDAQSPGLS